jgi:hypothetical protein
VQEFDLYSLAVTARALCVKPQLGSLRLVRGTYNSLYSPCGWRAYTPLHAWYEYGSGIHTSVLRRPRFARRSCAAGVILRIPVSSSERRTLSSRRSACFRYTQWHEASSVQSGSGRRGASAERRRLPLSACAAAQATFGATISTACHGCFSLAPLEVSSSVDTQNALCRGVPRPEPVRRYDGSVSLPQIMRSMIEHYGFRGFQRKSG